METPITAPFWLLIKSSYTIEYDVHIKKHTKLHKLQKWQKHTMLCVDKSCMLKSLFCDEYVPQKHNIPNVLQSLQISEWRLIASVDLKIIIWTLEH